MKVNDLGVKTEFDFEQCELHLTYLLLFLSPRPLTESLVIELPLPLQAIEMLVVALGCR
jgi:hypothetical protein